MYGLGHQLLCRIRRWVVRGLNEDLLEAGEVVLNGNGRFPEGGPERLHRGPLARRHPPVLGHEVLEYLPGAVGHVVVPHPNAHGLAVPLCHGDGLVEEVADGHLHVIRRVGDLLLVVELDVCVCLPLAVEAGVDGTVGSRADHGDPCRLAGQCVDILDLDHARVSSGA